MKKTRYIALLMAALPLMAKAELGEAGMNALAAGNYAEAAALLLADIDQNPKSKEALALYGYLGEALMKSGELDQAKNVMATGAAAGSPSATLMLGRICFEEFDFDGASQWYGKYAKLKNKGTESVDYERFVDQLEKAEDALNTVEKIAVIDSIAVSKDDFFKAYRLARSAGSLLPQSAAPKGASDFLIGPVFSSESGDFLMWSQENEEGVLTIAEAVRLTDGDWHLETAPVELMNGGGDAAYPFMMADGTTLYFANDGEDSIGGFDIFIASRDADTGEYMKPQNIGMPYNSPADDYLLAIDEENGIGWWATDRNHIPDKVTVYVYIPNEIRTNYDPDLENIADFARIANIRETWEEGADYASVTSQIATMSSGDNRQPDFIFPVSDRKTYHYYEELPNAQAKRAMAAYLDKQQEIEDDEQSLAQLRKNYTKDKGLKTEILALEKKMNTQREALKNLRNNVINLLR